MTIDRTYPIPLRDVGVSHYLLGGISTTWAFFLARINAVG